MCKRVLLLITISFVFSPHAFATLPYDDWPDLAGPYFGQETQGKFIEGSGKWKGVTGSFEWSTVVRSKPGQAAMPGTYQGCRKVKGTFELPK